MTTLTPELLADLRKKAEEAKGINPLKFYPGQLPQSLGLLRAAMKPEVVLALLDKLKEWEAYEDEVMKAQNDAGMSPRRAGEAIKNLLDRIEALEKKWERPSTWRCDGCGRVENVADGRRPDAHPSCGGYWVRIDHA